MVLGEALAAVGVEAVVEGLKGFQSAFNSMNDFVDKFSFKGSLLAKAFEPVNKVLGGFFDSLKRIGEFVIAGVILRGLEKITEALKNMAMELINAGAEFQSLKIRLENFIAADILAGGEVETMAEALGMAVEPAKELFNWIQKIAIATPFDVQDIANAFTMAKAWGFNTEEAKKLTQQVIDFTAGMGFTGEEMDRVIKALGQMKSLGRVAGQELLQLANAGVPVADIMEAIREELGLTTDEFEKLRAEGGVSAEMFFAQWEKLVNNRFLGSADRMSRTLQGVLGNVKDLVTGVLGFNVVTPVLDVVAGKFADILTALTGEGNADRLIQTAQSIGDALALLAERLFNTIIPGSPDAIANTILDFFERLAGKIIGLSEIIGQSIEGDVGILEFIGAIIDFLAGGPDAGTKAQQVWQTIVGVIDKIKEVFDAFREEGLLGALGELGVPESVLNFIGMIIQSFDNIVQFWKENKGDITEIFKQIAEGLGETLGLTGSLPEGDNSLLEIVGSLIVGLTQNLVDNGPAIVDKLSQIGDSITNDFLPAFREVAQWIADNQELVLYFLKSFAVGVIAWKVLAGVFAAIGTAFMGFIAIFLGSNILNEFRKLDLWRQGIENLRQYVASKINSMSDLGRQFVAGFFNGIINYFMSKYSYILYLFQWLINIIRGYLGIGSPSKLMEGIGENLMEGLQVGIEKAMNMPAMAMKMAVSQVVQPAVNPLQSSVTNNNQTVNNFNMNINTQAKAEPLVADFRMMQSFAGGG